MNSKFGLLALGFPLWVPVVFGLWALTGVVMALCTVGGIVTAIINKERLNRICKIGSLISALLFLIPLCIAGCLQASQ